MLSDGEGEVPMKQIGEERTADGKVKRVWASKALPEPYCTCEVKFLNADDVERLQTDGLRVMETCATGADVLGRHGACRAQAAT